VDTAILGLIVGTGALIVAAIGENCEWAKGSGAGTGKRAPTWSGKLLFGLVGAALVLVSLRDLIRG
jgi:hypothetical protein